MTLKDLIATLQLLLPGGEDLQVVVRCQVPHVDGWLHSENIRVVAESENGELVRIEGGFGA